MPIVLSLTPCFPSISLRVMLEGDESLIRQVFFNPLSNFRKYTRRRDIANIEIAGAEKDEENIYYVKDNGVGFDGEHAAKLFSLFNRFHSSE
jgi:chemotaxis family two-component system sensor kinase Cph1